MPKSISTVYLLINRFNHQLYPLSDPQTHIFLVALPTGGQCKATSTSKEAADHGVLASIVSASTVCGSPKSPWLIEVQPGQIVNITLVDFSLQQFEGDPSYATPHCHVIVIIREKTTMKTETVCGGGPEGLPHGKEWRRERNVFLSEHNVVEVRFNVEKITSTDAGHFLLLYQGIATLLASHLSHPS